MKAQTTIEWLMTYGWAILIILIVAGVLAYYEIFNPKGFTENVPYNCWSCCNCFNNSGNCYTSGCICNDSTTNINDNQICGYVQPHYLIP